MGGTDEGAFKGGVGGPGLLTETAVAAAFGGAGEGGDGVGRAVDVGMEVEQLAIAPGVAGQGGGRMQDEVPVERGAGRGEDLLQHPAHGEHGRAGIEAAAADLDLAHLAAGCRRALEHGDLQALHGELQGRHQPAYSGTDHDRTLAAHGFWHPSRLSLPHSACVYTE